MSESVPGSSVPDEFADAFGEPITNVLNLATWRSGSDLAALYDNLQREVAASVEQEKRAADPIRHLVFSKIGSGSDKHAPKSAGVYEITSEQVASVHAGQLFNGATECCDGTIAAHDSLLLSIVQIGVALVAYQGSAGTWVQRLYRRDLRATYPDPVAEAVALLERRQRREASETEEPREALNRLMRRALMEYAERAALADLSTALWRMGHGSPVPINLLVPTTPELVRASLDTLRRLLMGHRRWVYVASAPADRLMLTIGNALHPLQFAVVETLGAQFTNDRLNKIAQTQAGHPAERDLIQQFVREVREEIVVGVYRAGLLAPPRIFYAHKDFACEAAALAIADSTLQPHRGFPMLIDLADIVAGNTFDGASFNGTVQNAYAQAGEPTRYLGERETRA